MPITQKNIKPTCDNCFRSKAKLVTQINWGPCGWGKARQEKFVFRYYLCQWCMGVENRRRKKDGRTDLLKPIEYRPDEEILKEPRVGYERNER